MAEEREAILTKSKPWWKSKTMLFNIAVAVLLAVEANLPNMQGFIQPEAYAYILAGVNVTNMALRAVTRGPVTTR